MSLWNVFLEIANTCKKRSFNWSLLTTSVFTIPTITFFAFKQTHVLFNAWSVNVVLHKAKHSSDIHQFNTADIFSLFTKTVNTKKWKQTGIAKNKITPLAHRIKARDAQSAVSRGQNNSNGAAPSGQSVQTSKPTAQLTRRGGNNNGSPEGRALELHGIEWGRHFCPTRWMSFPLLLPLPGFWTDASYRTFRSPPFSCS